MAFTIQKICDGIEKIIQACRLPVTYIPASILSCSALQRPGLSPMVIASNIIKRQTEAGAPYGPAADGTQNVAEAMEVIRVEELVKALKLDGAVQVGIPAGSIQCTGVAMSSSGPIVVNVSNTNPVHGGGIMC